MKGLMMRWAISALGLLLTAAVLPGIRIGGVFSAFVAAAVLGIFNALLRPVILVLTLPINILTLGLFTLVINGLMLQLVGSVIKGVEIDGLGWAVLGSLILGIINWGASAFIGDRGKVEVIELRKSRDGTWQI
ncbi:MAG: phage holin family protein [bacterium]